MMPLCSRTNLEVHMIYETPKYFSKFDPRQKKSKFCEFWNPTTGHCAKDQKNATKGSRWRSKNKSYFFTDCPMLGFVGIPVS